MSVREMTAQRQPWAPNKLRLAVTLAMALGVGLGVAPVLAQTAPSAQESAFSAEYDFDIPAQPRLAALGAFTATTGLSLIRPSDQAIAGQAPALQGQMSAALALDRLLEGSGLRALVQPGGEVLLEPLPSAGAARLEQLTVTARRDDWVYQTPRSVSVITREQMDRLPVRHAAELLEETPGVTSAVNRLNPGLSINIRGMQDFGRVNMMIDGMRQNFVSNGHQQRNGEMYVDSELLSGATVERGPRADVHGAGAIAGQVNFSTLDFDDLIKPGRDFGGRLRGNTGLGGEGNGVDFIGSLAVAGRIDDRLELLAARSRRSIGDYDIGRHGGNGLNRAWTDTGYDGYYDSVKFADQQQDSQLFKAKYKISPEQSIQFSYIGTEISYANTTDADTSLQASGTPWRSLGSSRVESENFGLDYKWNPSDNDLIDLNVKLYYVDTKNRNYSNPTYPASGSVLVDYAWDYGYCDLDPIPDSWASSCSYGTGRNQRIEMETYGLQIDNTSRWQLNQTTQLRANYGLEYFQDRAESWITTDREGRQVSAAAGDTLNPMGRRTMGSLFTNLTLEDDFYTLSAGLRYDRYWLKGDTQVWGTESNYVSRLDRFINYNCNRSSAYSVAACEAARSGGEQGAIAYAGDLYWTRGYYAPGWEDEQVLNDYHVDRSEDKFLPSLGAAIRPASWLELYANWGKSWRPPAINESLMAGSHPGDPFASMYPNPYAEPETTTSWEVGANTTFRDLFTQGDMLFAKLSYFDTKADNYLFTSIQNQVPGEIAGGLGRLVFNNNLAQTRFRGIELESRYDAGWIYGGATYTHYVGGPNTFCQRRWWLGSGISQYDQPNEDGSMTEEHQQAVADGYDSYEESLDNEVRCGNLAYNSVVAMPVDKGTANLGVRLFDRRLDTGVRFNYSGSGWYNRSTGGGQTWYTTTTWDWYGSYLLNPNVKLMASIDNVTDRMYLDGYSDALARTWAPGRTVQMGFEILF
ncbi:TonB-dependent receptor [Halotalea alkalilenta]|nr:TonB-dependent receptor [Halotalea alkalilenta]